jgi:hypothetical protein
MGTGAGGVAAASAGTPDGKPVERVVLRVWGNFFGRAVTNGANLGPAAV